MLNIGETVFQALEQANQIVQILGDGVLIEPNGTRHPFKGERGRERDFLDELIIQGDALIWIYTPTLPDGIVPYTGWGLEFEGVTYEILNNVVTPGNDGTEYACDCASYRDGS